MLLKKLAKTLSIILLHSLALILAGCPEDKPPKIEPCLVEDPKSGLCRHHDMIDQDHLIFKATDKFEVIKPGAYLLQPGNDHDFPHTLIYIRDSKADCESR